MIEKPISKALISNLKEDYGEILQYLLEKDYIIQNLPSDLTAKKNFGEAYALAYPIQGILKYHGIANEDHRIAYFPSISLNNDCSYTISYLKFDENLFYPFQLHGWVYIFAQWFLPGRFWSPKCRR